MQGAKKIINFKFEKLKHNLSRLIYKIKQYIADIFRQRSTSRVIDIKEYNKKKKIKKFKY
jgi:hypothetical protein